MSLVGSLEDLGLGDILQIVSLSRKSGVLALRSESGEGRIVLCEGLVRGGSIKGEPEDLRALLVSRGEVSAEDFDRAAAQARQRGAPVEQAVSEAAGIDPDRLEALRREQVERAVMRMFLWRSGEFSFEVRDQIEGSDAELLLAQGVSTQYLAMEATRLRDESAKPTAIPGPSAVDEETDDIPMFSGESASGAAAEVSREPERPADVLALAAAQRADAEGDAEAPGEAVETEEPARVPALDASGTGEPAAVPSESAGVTDDEEGPAVPADRPGARAIPVVSEPQRATLVRVTPAAPLVAGAAEAPPARFRHVVVIDPNLAGLEWFKASLRGMFERIHIFQRSEAGIERIRQYLGRGVVPLVVVSPRASGDPLTGIRNVRDLIRRLRVLAPQISVVAVVEAGAGKPALDGVDRVVSRPAAPGLDPERWGRFEPLAEQLRQAMSDLADASRAPERPARSGKGPEDLDQLRQISHRLRDPNTQGEVLSLVLDFAAERFSRVAIFMVREDVAIGMAQRGLARCNGPDDQELSRVRIGAVRGSHGGSELFAAVIEARAAMRASMDTDGDRRLARLLGSRVPGEVYVAPIESSGCVVALLYADNLPDEEPLPDTAGLEIMLHEAGLALDRALLQRTLAIAHEQD